MAQADRPRPGDVVYARISKAAPHHLVADGHEVRVRRTRSGQAWQDKAEGGDSCGVPAPSANAGATPGVISLGIPVRRGL